MKNKLLLFIILIIAILFYNSDFIQEKINTEEFYRNKSNLLEGELAKLDKVIKFQFEMVNSATNDAKKSLNDYIEIYSESEKNLSHEEIKQKAKKQVENVILSLKKALEKTIDKRNKLSDKMKKFKYKLKMIKKRS